MPSAGRWRPVCARLRPLPSGVARSSSPAPAATMPWPSPPPSAAPTRPSATASTRPHLLRPAFDAATAERLRDVLHRSPRDFGHPTSLWTLELAAETAHAEGLTATRVTGETVRATLARLGIQWKRAKGWITSP